MRRGATSLAAALLAVLAAAAVVPAAVAPAAAARDVPFLSGRVVDEASLLSPDARARIEAKLAAYERQTGRQIAVLTIDSLEGEVLEDYANRVGRTWALGREGEDDGVLFLIVPGERKMRIEVGYGLEPQLTDLESSNILDEQVAPRFRTGDFDAGVEAGVDAILAHLGVGEEPPPPPRPGTGLPAGARLLGLVLFFGVVGTFSATALTAPGCVGWGLWIFLLPFYFAFPSILIHPGAGAALGLLWLVAFPVLRVWIARKGPPRGGGGIRRSGGGWLGPVLWGGALGRGFGGGRSGGFGGGGGFGGFSGGGGSFGGGGASGSW